MHVIRPIKQDDFETYCQFSFAARLGMSSMPKNRELLQKNIQTSLEAFKTAGSLYLFVLENAASKVIEGTCGIYSQVGIEHPYYYYREEIEELQPYNGLPIPRQMRLLKPIEIKAGPSEICSLYLSPASRKGGLGKLLSLSRFLFIAAFPERFQEEIIAEMRGWIDNKTTPFWEHLGHHFLNLTYEEVQKLKETDKNFIPYILPKHPIYIDLLPKEARDLIGKVHENTRPALKMLDREGFLHQKDYDVFDAGPIVKASRDKIRTIRLSSKLQVKEVASHIDSQLHLLSNVKLTFRSCASTLKFVENGIAIPAATAEALQVERGDFVIYAPL